MQMLLNLKYSTKKKANHTLQTKPKRPNKHKSPTVKQSHQGIGKEQQRKNKLHLPNDILQFHIRATKAETHPSYCTVRIKGSTLKEET